MTFLLTFFRKSIVCRHSSDMDGFFCFGQVNAEKVAVTGKKRSQKIYRRHSGRPGGMTEEVFDDLQRRIPERIVEHAVRGMLPKGRVCIHFFCLAPSSLLANISMISFSEREAI